MAPEGRRWSAVTPSGPQDLCHSGFSWRRKHSWGFAYLMICLAAGAGRRRGLLRPVPDARGSKLPCYAGQRLRRRDTGP